MPIYNFVPLTCQVEARAHENDTISNVSTPKPKPNETTPSQAQPPNRRTTLFPRVPNRKSCYQRSWPKLIRFRHSLVTTTYATNCTTHLTKADFHYSNEDIKFFKLRSRAQGEVPLQPRPDWYIEQAINNNNKGALDKGAARGYAYFQFKKCNMIRDNSV